MTAKYIWKEYVTEFIKISFWTNLLVYIKYANITSYVLVSLNHSYKISIDLL